ncbi:hypothetical protein Q7C18_02880 [Nesterenkonia sp. CL21]|nr:hypothetical protein [Nesterenkonia sp. CL21]MDS2171632.1 hypothetical protein [Nesterenkonia sp. CL21]
MTNWSYTRLASGTTVDVSTTIDTDGKEVILVDVYVNDTARTGETVLRVH